MIIVTLNKFFLVKILKLVYNYITIEVHHTSLHFSTFLKLSLDIFLKITPINISYISSK